MSLGLTQISTVFFPYWGFFRQVISGLCSDSILCKLSLSSVLVFHHMFECNRGITYCYVCGARPKTAIRNQMVFLIHVVLRGGVEISL